MTEEAKVTSKSRRCVMVVNVKIIRIKVTDKIINKVKVTRGT